MNSEVKKKRPPQPPDSLLEDVVHDSEKSWRRWVRTAVLTLFILVILAGVTGLFDLGGSKHAELGDAKVEVSYPVTTRAGMDLRVIVDIRSDEELPDTIRLETDRDYIEMFEDLLFVPEAAEQLSLDNNILRTEYDVPEGVKYVRFLIEGRASDQWEPRTVGTLRVFGSDGTETEVLLTTWRMP